MAVDMFLKIDDIKGEAHGHGHKDEIDILAFSWGLSNSSSHIGGGHGAGKVNVQDISFTHYIDTASTKLLLHAAQGSHIKEALLTVRKAGGVKGVDYLKIKLTDVMVTSVSTGGSGGEDRLTENVTLAFNKVEVTYTAQDEKGAGKPGTPFTWNVKENKK